MEPIVSQYYGSNLLLVHVIYTTVSKLSVVMIVLCKVCVVVIVSSW